MVTAAREYHQSMVHYFRKTLTPVQGSAVNVTVGVLPGNAILSPSSGVWITTAFNGTTPTINVGVTGTPKLYASDLVAGAAGFLALDDVSLAAAAPVATDRTVTANLTFTNTTTGSAEVIVAYIPASR